MKIHTFKLKPRLTRRKAITLCMKWWQPFLTQIWVATDLAPHMLTQHWKAGEKQRILHFIEANWWHTHVVPAWKGTFLSPSFTSSQSAVSILTAVLVWSKGLSLRNHKSSVVSETMAVSTSCWRRNRRDHLGAQGINSRRTSTAATATGNASPFFLPGPGLLLQSCLGEKGAGHYSHKDTPGGEQHDAHCPCKLAIQQLSTTVSTSALSNNFQHREGAPTAIPSKLWSAEGPPADNRVPCLFQNNIKVNQPPDVKGWDWNTEGRGWKSWSGKGRERTITLLESKRGEEENTVHLFKMSTHLVSLNICWSITSGLVIASEVA